MEPVSDQGEVRFMRRRTFLINRKFQLKYTLVIVLVGVLVSAVLGYFVYELSSVATDMATMERIGSASGEVSTEDSEFLEKTKAEIRDNFDTQVLVGLGGFVGLMALFLFLWGILITHRVAGPIFIISRYLSQIKDGKVPHVRPLRRGDELKEFFDTFSGMLNHLIKNNLQEAKTLETCAGKIRELGAQSLEDTAKSLEELASKKRNWEEVAQGS